MGVNPKVNNLIRSFRAATHDILWVLDSGVMVDPGTLARSVDILTTLPSSSRIPRSIALVHHVPLALVNGLQIGSRLEAAFLNTNHAKMYIAINTVGIESCVVGKSNLYRRSDTDRLNASFVPIRLQTTPEPREYGLRAFGKYLAEDNMIASAIWHELGLRHDLSCDVARNVIGNMSFSDYVWRRVRWIRVRKHMVLAATIIEPFTESVALSIIGSLSGRFLLNIPTLLFIILHFVLWLSVDLDVYASMASKKEIDPAFILAWVAREILAFPIWLLAIFGDEVVWRGQKYRVLKNGEAMLCTSQKSSVYSSWLGSLSRPQQYHHI